jgi:hypothetical protein
MRITGIALFLAALGMSASACAAPPPPESSLAALKSWVGVYFPKKDQPITRFWDEPALQQEARKALDGPHYEALFNGWAQEVTTPIEQKGDILFAFACKEHACNANSARLYVNLKYNTVSVCWHDQAGMDQWFSSQEKPKDLEGKGCSSADDFGIYKLFGKE